MPRPKRRTCGRCPASSDYVEAHYNLGVALQDRGRLAEAAASYERALKHRPNHVEAHSNLGNTLQAQGKPEQAMACYRRAIALQPDFAQAHSNLGNVLKIQGRLAEALDCYDRALALKPDYGEAHGNRGIVLLEQGKLDDAAVAFQRALAHQPHNAEAHDNLGNALKEQGRRDRALACYHRALALQPDYAGARLDLAIAVIPIFADSAGESSAVEEQFTRSLDELGAWNAANPGKLGKAVGRNQPFYLAYRPFDVTALLSRYGDVVAPAAADFWQPLIGDNRRAEPPRDRIRIVVVSGQVRQHPVWDVVLRGIIGHIDRRQFEILVYHTSAIADEETAPGTGPGRSIRTGPKADARLAG